MRVLVAGRNAEVLATTAGAFANDLQIETATTKAASFALLERTEFDLIVACETLGDGSGLEVLSHVAVNAPNTLRIFAARPSTLNLLKGELGLFGLFRTLPYPINFRKLWAAINLARGTCADAQPASQLKRQAVSAGKPVPIPQSEAFRRALAKRNAARLGAPAVKKRAALWVGSGIFAGTTAAVLTFFMMNVNNSMDRSKLPPIASINRPGPNKVFPWQPQAQQPTRPATFPGSESSAPAAADLEVEAEAASENFEIEPGHPGPPQPNPPPPSSEPPSLESPAEPADE